VALMDSPLRPGLDCLNDVPSGIGHQGFPSGGRQDPQLRICPANVHSKFSFGICLKGFPSGSSLRIFLN